MQKFLAFAFLMASMAGSCLAIPITWSSSFYPTAVAPTGVDLGVTSKTFTSNAGGYLLTATSLNITNLPNSISVLGTYTPTFSSTVSNLGWKNEGAPQLEHGLGIYSPGYNDAEIRSTNALQINLSAIPSFVNVAFTIDSIDPGEGFRIFGSTTATGQRTLLATGVGGAFVQTATFNSTFRFFDITSNTPGSPVSSVLLRSVATDAVPEPASLGMIGLGFLAIGAARFRKKLANR